MNKEQLLNEWLEEEKAAHIHGWDFSHIHGKYEEGIIYLGITAKLFAAIYCLK